MLKFILIIIGIIATFGILFFIYIFINMAFLGIITELKLKFKKEGEPLADGVLLSEVSKNEEPWPHPMRKIHPDPNDLRVAQEMTLLKDGRLSPERRSFDNDPGVEALVLRSERGEPMLIFQDNEVYKAGMEGRKERSGSFSDPELSSVRYIYNLNDTYFLMIGDPAAYKYVYSYLWQVKKESLEKQKIAENPCYTFAAPPRIFYPEGFGGAVAVYYTGSENWGFGGDCSRPEYSIVRIYNDQFKEGLDVAKFSFRAGTIVKVEWKEGGLIATGNPSRPVAANQKPRPARVWRIELS